MSDVFERFKPLAVQVEIRHDASPVCAFRDVASLVEPQPERLVK